MNRIKALLPVLGLCGIIAGCTPEIPENEDLTNNESESVVLEESTDTGSEESELAVEETQEDEAEQSESVTDDSVVNSKSDAETSETISKLLSGEGKLSFTYYKDNILKNDQNQYYAEEFMSLVPTDKEYTISELIKEFNDIFKDENNYFADGEVTSVESAPIDLGADGVEELALRFTGPFVEPESEATLIIKELDGKAQVVYAFVIWSRSFTEINKYGLVSGDGSNGASNHGWDMALVDAEGKYNFGYYEEQEYDFNSFAMSMEHDKYDDSALEGTICTYSLRLENTGSDVLMPEYYTYEVLSKEDYEKIEVPDLYTDSEYKKVMDSFKDIKVVSMDEFEKIKADKLTSIGVTDDILNAMGPFFEKVDASVSGLEQVENDSEEETKVVKDAKPINDDGSVQSEVAMVEARHQEYENLDWADMPQMELNLTTGEMFELWDEELNSIWSRLIKEVTPEKKEELLADQRKWIKRKETAVKEAGSEALGGTLQPQLENGTAWSYTRKRVYYLASVLAETRGENFEVPAEVEESYKDIDTN